MSVTTARPGPVRAWAGHRDGHGRRRDVTSHWHGVTVTARLQLQTSLASDSGEMLAEARRD